MSVVQLRRVKCRISQQYNIKTKRHDYYKRSGGALFQTSALIEVQVPTFYEIITDDQQTKPTDQPKDGHVRSHGEVTLQTTIAIHSVQKLLLHQ